MLPDSSVCSLINQHRLRDGLVIPSHPPFPFSSHTISRSLSISLSLSLPSLGVASPPLPPSQLKDRAYPLDPFSCDRGLKEPRRVSSSPAPEPPLGGAPPLKIRRHSDTDKPKGKRPCKTKHTGQKEREKEKRKDGAPHSPVQHCEADPAALEDDKVSADRLSGHDMGSGCFSAAAVRFSMPVGASDYAAGAGEGGRGEKGSMLTMFRGLLEL